MLTLYKNIKRLREEKGLSQEALAKMTGYTDRSSITKIEKGLVDLPQSKIELFAQALGTTSSDLVGWDDATSTPTYQNIHSITTQKLPVLGKIACGVPSYANEERESYVLAGTEIDADFCLIASGDSMTGARIYDGDIVFIRKQEIVENGEIAAVVINSEATLKRFFYYQEKSLLILKAENPKYADLIYTDGELEQVHVLGKAIAFQSDIR